MNPRWIAALPFVVLCMLAVILRFWHLAEIPLALYHDEMDYVATGEAIARFDSDISGQWSPLQFVPLRTLNITAELPAVFHAGVQTLFGLGPQTAHLPAALFGLATVVLAGVLTYALSNNHRLAFLVALSLASNPWHVYISRLGYEAVISLFFQLVFISGLWLSVQTKRKDRQLLAVGIMVVGIVFAFFSYHAAKFSMPVFVLAGSVWLWREKTLRVWHRYTTLAILVFTGALLVFTQFSPGRTLLESRGSNLIFSNAYLASQVDTERRLSLTYSPFSNSWLTNKLAVLITSATDRYLSVFDVYRLFVSGYEGGFQFSLAVHGFFYLSSIPLVLLGIRWWAKAHRKAFTFILTFLLLAPIASTITISYQSIFRSGITYLLMSFLIGAGAYAALQAVSKLRQPTIGIFLLGLLLCMEATWFGFRYFTRYPLVSAENHYFFEKLLAGYVRRVSDPIVVVVEGDPYSPARALVIYNHLLAQLTAAERQQFAEPKRDTYTFANMIVTNVCPEPSASAAAVIVVDSAMLQTCQYDLSNSPEKSRKYGLGSPTDSRMYYYLLNDTICVGVPLPAFIYNASLDDYQFDTLSNQDFCQRWVQEEKAR